MFSPVDQTLPACVAAKESVASSPRTVKETQEQKDVQEKHVGDRQAN